MSIEWHLWVHSRQGWMGQEVVSVLVECGVGLGEVGRAGLGDRLVTHLPFFSTGSRRHYEPPQPDSLVRPATQSLHPAS